MLPLVLAFALAQAPSGAAVFDNHCAACHAGSTDARVPTVAALRQRTPEAIVDALVSGAMRQQGAELTDADRRAVAEFLGTRSDVARRLQPGDAPGLDSQCASPRPLNLSSGPRWNGWGADLSNTRFQPASQAGLTAAQVPKLTLKWAFGFPNATSARAQPTIAGGRLFVGSQSGLVYALDAVSGCTIWTFQAQAAVRSAITIGPRGSGSAAYFGDGKANAYAVDAGTGTLLWTRNLDEHASARVTGGPTLFENRLYVPIASGEEGQGNNPKYECCSFRGSLVALDLATGAIAWTAQVTPKDVFVVGCNQPNPANCPAEVGPDFDFGSSPILAKLANGKELIVDGQKSGVGWAFDPDARGAVTWQYRAAKGSALGGMEFGSAVDGEQAYFAVADGNSPQPGGLHAVTLATGERAWYAPPPAPKCGAPGRGCNAAILAAITVIPGVVFTGSNDGGLRGYSTKDGSLLWEYDTNRDFETVNGVPAKGASISGPGPVVAGGMLYVNSGYGALGGRPGNVLLAFGLPDVGPPKVRADLQVRPKVPVPVAPANPRDLDGVWSYATLTPFERPAELGEFFTAAQAEEFEAQTIGRNDRDRRDGGAAVDAARGVADYWFDRGEHVATLNGRMRTSWVIDPPDGKVPPLTAEARARQAARNADQRDHPADGPENRSLQERCLAFNAGPPIGLGPYNNFLQIFQSRDAVVIYTEMIHDARIVWTDGRPHAPPVFRRWLGDSRGRWEGSTLVVDTANFTDKNPFRGSGGNLHLTERFTRADANTLLYEFTVDDPSTFTKPWTAQLPMTKSDERMFEYACHEGNYALPDILRGARFQEQQSK